MALHHLLRLLHPGTSLLHSGIYGTLRILHPPAGLLHMPVHPVHTALIGFIQPLMHKPRICRLFSCIFCRLATAAAKLSS